MRLVRCQPVERPLRVPLALPQCAHLAAHLGECRGEFVQPCFQIQQFKRLRLCVVYRAGQIDVEEARYLAQLAAQFAQVEKG